MNRVFSIPVLAVAMMLAACGAGDRAPNAQSESDSAGVAGEPARAATSQVAAQPSADGNPAYWVENFRWSAEAGERQQIRVVNRFGDIRGRSAVDDAVMLSAMIQKIGSRTDEFDFAIAEDADGFVIEVRPLVDTPAGRVDVVLLSPHGMTLTLETHDGMIRTKRLASHIDATTRDGTIQLIDPLSVMARSEGGNIQVQLAGERPELPFEIETATGQVDVYLPAAVHLSLDIGSGGQIHRGFAGKAAPGLVAGGDSDRNTLRGDLGGGGSVFVIRSESGPVRIHPLM